MICASGVLHASSFNNASSDSLLSIYNDSSESVYSQDADIQAPMPEPDGEFVAPNPPEPNDGAPVQLPNDALDKKKAKKDKDKTPKIIGPTPLVPIDRDEADWIKEANKAIADKKYDRAIKILQALVEKKNAGYFRISKTLFKSINQKASQMIGELPKKALEEYHLIYEPIAEAKYNKAMKTGDLGLLREILVLYANTSVAKKANIALADSYFDQGKLLSAVRSWLKLGDFKTPEDAIRLVKIITALHLAGNQKLVKLYQKKLTAKFADQIAILAGKQQKLTDYVKNIIKVKPFAKEQALTIGENFPGVGALSESFIKMEPLDAVLLPRWKYPNTGNNSNLYITDQMLAFGAMDYIENYSVKITGVSLDDGLVELSVANPQNRGSSGRGNVGRRKFFPPAMVQPNVWNNLVIFRDDKGVVALNIKTGEVAWKGELPMFKHNKIISNRYDYYGSQGSKIVDTGKYLITIGGGKVYAVGNFSKAESKNRHSFGDEKPTEKPKNNILSAFSLENEGCIEWINGGSIKPKPTGDKDIDQFMTEIEYLTAPAYVSQPGSETGRLYLIVKHLSQYFLVCLNADDGSYIWRQAVGQQSTQKNVYGKAAQEITRVACVPVYRDGKVYIATNSGLISSFDAESGRPSWAYQYVPSRTGYYGGGSRRVVCTSALNQIIVTDKHVVAYPVDSTKVIVLDKNTGKGSYANRKTGVPMESSDRMLVAIDADTIAVVGSNIKFIRLSDGAIYRCLHKVNAYYGRPVIAGKYLLAVCKGYLLKVDIKKFTQEAIPLDDAEGLLGNMVCMKNKLICANSAGIAAYFNFDVAYSVLTDKINAAKTIDQKLYARYQRAKLCANSGKYIKAKADYDQASEDIKGKADYHILLHQLNNNYHKMYIRQANQATGAKRLKYYKLAKEYATTPNQEALMLIRLAKFYETQKQYEKAVECAISVGNNYSKQPIIDIPIGKQGNNANKIRKMPTMLAKDWALDTRQGFVRKLINKHGQKIYAAYDAKAKVALDAVKTTGQPRLIEKVALDYPLSKHADEAKLIAAEEYYNKAAKVSAVTRKAYLRNVNRLIDSIMINRGTLPESVRNKDRVYMTALVTKLVIKQNQGFKRSVSLDISDMDDIEDDMDIKFGNIKGKLENVLENIQKDKYIFAKVKLAVYPNLPTPVEFAYKVGGADGILLGDGYGNVTRLGDMVFVLSEGKTYVVKPGADKKDSIKVVADTKIKQRWGTQPYQVYRKFYAAVTEDYKNCLVSNGVELASFKIVDGKVNWRIDMSKFVTQNTKWRVTNGYNFRSVQLGSKITVAVSNYGEIIAFDNMTGKVKWKNNLPLQSNGSYRLYTNGLEILDECTLVVSSNSNIFMAYSNKTGKMVFNYDVATSGSGARVYRKGRRRPYYGSRAPSYKVSKSGELVILTGTLMRTFMLSGNTSVHKPISEHKINPVNNGRLALYQDKYAVIVGNNDVAIYNAKSKRQHKLIMPSFNSSNPNDLNVVGKPNNYNNRQGLAITNIAIDSDTLYMTASLRPGGYYYNKRFKKYASGLAVLKYDLKSGKLVWAKKILDKNANCSHTNMEICSSNLVIGNTTNQHSTGALYIVSKKNGSIEQEIELYKNEMPVRQYNNRMERIGRFEAFDSKIVAEDLEGVKVFISK